MARISSTPTSDELANIKLTAQKLWQLDENRINAPEEFELDLQGGKSFHATSDAAGSKLFKKVSKAVWDKPTYRIFYYILDNYETATGTAETISTEEKKEMNDFLDAIIATRPMKYCHKYCVAKGMAKASLADWKSQLYQMWFALYRRDGGGNDSSGFEHVFVGESDEGKISGFHNWIQFWIQEAKGHVDYRGYIHPRPRAGEVDNEDRVLSVQLAWKGELKQISTFFIGTSPEFEMALYSLFFLCGEEYNEVEVGAYDLAIRAYRIKSKYGDKVGSVFPELLKEDFANSMAGLDLDDKAAAEA